jgi:hypothetical protein
LRKSERHYINNETRNDYHEDDDKPVKRVFENVPVKHDTLLLQSASAYGVGRRSAGIASTQEMESLRERRENQETDSGHQDDSHPVHEIPRDDIFIHLHPLDALFSYWG